METSENRFRMSCVKGRIEPELIIGARRWSSWSTIDEVQIVYRGSEEIDEMNVARNQQYCIECLLLAAAYKTRVH